MYRVAILGAGIGAQHAAAFATLSDRFQLVAVCDRDESRARALAAPIAGCRIEHDVDAVLGADDIDIIDICLPPYLHAATAMRALEAGYHVICEKPMAGSVQDADAMAKAAIASGKILTPIFQYRYGPGLAQLSALVEAGLSGKPYVATLETHWDRGADYYAIDWRGTWAGEQGGAVLGHAIHIHDLISQFFGPASAVSALLDTRVNDIETEDCAALSIKTESGGLVSSSITLGAADNSSRLRLVFERLTAESGSNPYAPGQDPWTYTARAPAEQAAIDDLMRRVEGGAPGYAGQFLALANTLDGEPANLVSPADGIRSLEFIAAVYLSSREQRSIALPLDRSHPICADWTP